MLQFYTVFSFIWWLGFNNPVLLLLLLLFLPFFHNTVFQIRVIERNCEIPHEGPFCDLMWSDPEDIETWAVSPRGAGWLFGSRVTSEVKINK